jgi:quercetin dioxygenase-like cupin family protein
MTESYFSDAAASRLESDRGAFCRIDEQPLVAAAPGVNLRPVAGRGLMLSHVTIEPHSEAPTHTHDEEQMGIVLEGTCEFELDGEVRTVGPGDVYHAPPGIPHGVRTGAGRCVIIDMFSPPRRALLDLMRGAD